MIKFTIPGHPVPQGRPRFYRRGKFVGTYDPAESASFKNRVALFAKQAQPKPLDGAVSVTATFYLKRPKSMMGKKWLDMPEPCIKRPDIDNLIKAILDGCNGVLWHDDGQVCSIFCEKKYHEKTGSPRTEIEIGNAGE